MKVRISRPIDEIAGRKEVELRMKGSLLVEELLETLGNQIPTLRRQLRSDNDEVLSYFVLLVRGDEILRMQDVVREQDTVTVLPPISGG